MFSLLVDLSQVQAGEWTRISPASYDPSQGAVIPATCTDYKLASRPASEAHQSFS